MTTAAVETGAADLQHNGNVEQTATVDVAATTPRTGAVQDNLKRALSVVANGFHAILKRLRPARLAETTAVSTPISAEPEPAAVTAPLLRDFISTGLKIRRPADMSGEASITRRALELTK